MALRIRKNGRILCAAIHKKEVGDTYIDDELHYELSVVKKVLVTEYFDNHILHGEWYWKGNIPKDVIIDNFYLLENI